MTSFLAPIRHRFDHARLRVFQIAGLAWLALAGDPAFAQFNPGGGGGTSIFDSMVTMGCSFLSPLVGSNSKVLSLVFLLLLVVMLFAWWLNENKEGLLMWVIRAGLVVGILINIFTLPPMLGMASVC